MAWLDQQPSVAKNRKVRTQGYCMGGPMAFRTAVAVPDRVGAVASFHGGGLVAPAPNTFAKADLPAEIEVYTGAAHGWCPPDSGVYNEPQAEKASVARIIALDADAAMTWETPSGISAAGARTVSSPIRTSNMPLVIVRA